MYFIGLDFFLPVEDINSIVDYNISTSILEANEVINQAQKYRLWMQYISLYLPLPYLPQPGLGYEC